MARGVDSGTSRDELAQDDISIITSQIGPLAAYGEAYLADFDVGLDYATDYTGTVDGRELNIEITDDDGDADKAVTAAKTVIGQGKKFVIGTVCSWSQFLVQAATRFAVVSCASNG